MRPVPGLNRFNGDVTPRKFFFQEEKRVIKKLDIVLSKNVKESLDAILEQDDFFYKFTF